MNDESGFLLVGVVMFVLALTILGLSLYSLSSYEADFQMQSRDSNASYYRAQGGLAMVQALLATTPYKLSTAHSAVGHGNIEYATAWQVRTGGVVDSTGSIDWSKKVTVVVRTRVQDQQHMLQADYMPVQHEDYYKRLFTIGGPAVSRSPGVVFASIYVESDNPPFDGGMSNQRMQTVFLGDTAHVWQDAADSSWVGRTDWEKDRPLRVGGLPLPDVGTYYANHPATLVPSLVGSGNGTKWRFDKHAAGTVGYYQTPVPDANYSFYESNYSIELDVQGTAVWELPEGFRGDQEVTVRSTGPGAGTLVIVGSPNPGRTGQYNDPVIGVWFFGGLNVPDNTSVILVSDGQVNIERDNNATHNEQAIRLSVYSNGLYLMGPRLGDHSRLDHLADMDSAIDDLESVDALPRPTGAVPGLFTLLRGSWRDLTP